MDQRSRTVPQVMKTGLEQSSKQILQANDLLGDMAQIVGRSPDMDMRKGERRTMALVLETGRPGRIVVSGLLRNLDAVPGS